MSATLQDLTAEVLSVEELAVSEAVDAVEILREYYTVNETSKAAEARLKELKPIVDSLRVEGVKETIIPGSWRNKKGKYKILRVEKTQDFASVEVLQMLLSKGKITTEIYELIVKTVPVKYNLVSWKATL